MNEVLSHAIQAVASERGGKFDDAFRAAKVLVAEYGETDIANRIALEVPDSVSWEVVADLLGILQWSTEDNGASIHYSAERWLLDGDDLRKIQIALHLDTYPFIDLQRMRQVLEYLAQTRPEVAARCRTLIEQRSAEASA